jgi:hypothetical protein
MAYEMRRVPPPVVYCNAYCSGKGDAEKLEITANTNVYRYRRVHIRAFCGVGVLCRGCCEALMCNIQTSTLVKTSWALLNSSIFQSTDSVDLDVLLSAQK